MWSLVKDLSFFGCWGSSSIIWSRTPWEKLCELVADDARLFFQYRCFDLLSSTCAASDIGISEILSSFSLYSIACFKADSFSDTFDCARRATSSVCSAFFLARMLLLKAMIALRPATFWLCTWVISCSALWTAVDNTAFESSNWRFAAAAWTSAASFFALIWI